MKTTLNTISGIALIAFVLYSFTFKDGKKNKKSTDNISEFSNVAVVVIGYIVNTGFDFEKAKYRLYRDNQFAGSGYTYKFGTMELHLMRNSRYLLEVSAKNFITKKIYFNTIVNEKNRTVRFFDFEIELLYNENLDENSICELDIPFAVVYFNPSLNEFDYDKEYTEKIMELEKEILN